MDNHFDFVVVGAGSAGAVIAARLSEHPDTQVLALEAGGMTFPAGVHRAPEWYTLLGSSVDWGYTTVPQPGLDYRQIREPRGKLPGGTSNLHLMIHIRGHRSDFDNWAYSGCPGWAYDDVLPYFQRLEDQEDDTNPTAGKGGPMHVANASLNHPNPTSLAFVDACLELGFPYSEDFNGPQMEGAGWHHINVKAGKRHGTFAGYLKLALERPNLCLETNAHATRLLFDGRRCVGVEYVQHGAVHTAYADREVIVCAGAIESPKLLLLSGIGGPAHLREFDIPVVADLPGVGENFHNHILTGVVMHAVQPVPEGNQNLSEVALFCKSHPGWVGPDLQICFVHVPFSVIDEEFSNSISILPGVVRPLSRGWVRLAGRDPLAMPLINPNYLAVPADEERLIESVKLAREIFATRAFASWVGQELTPGGDVRTHEELRAYVRQSADSYHHQAGSCKMGLDAMAVVDPELRVYGVEGLRVADASVMPVVPSGNCHTAIVMIGERCADLIKAAHGLA